MICDQGQIPSCRLHNRPLIGGLPQGCPLRSEQSLQALAEIQDRAYAHLAPGPDQDTTRGLIALRRVEICESCITRLARNRWVLQLRVLAQASPPADPAPRPARVATRTNGTHPRGPVRESEPAGPIQVSSRWRRTRRAVQA